MKPEDGKTKASDDINKFLSQQIVASEEIEQAMYIQIEEPDERRKKMKLVKQKPDENHSPRPRKIANNEGEVSDVSEVEPAPNTGQNMLRLNLKFDSLEDILERFQNQIS